MRWEITILSAVALVVLGNPHHINRWVFSPPETRFDRAEGNHDRTTSIAFAIIATSQRNKKPRSEGGLSITGRAQAAGRSCRSADARHVYLGTGRVATTGETEALGFRVAYGLAWQPAHDKPPPRDVKRSADCNYVFAVAKLLWQAGLSPLHRL